MVSGTQIVTALTNLMDTIPASNDKLLEWINYLNRETYRGIVSVAPKKLITRKTLQVVADDPFVSYPSDFKSIRTIGTGIYKVNTSGSYYQAIAYDAQTGDFTVGLVVTGDTSEAYGTIVDIYDDGATGVLTLKDVSGTFEDDEALTDTSTGAAVANGTATAFYESNEPLTPTGEGSSKVGYWLDGTNSQFVFTPMPDGTNHYRLRYIPTLTTLTALTDETQIPEEYLEYARNFLNIYLQEYLSNIGGEQNANSRFVKDFNTFLNDIQEEVPNYNETDLSTLF
jgi:hypothetical protein